MSLIELSVSWQISVILFFLIVFSLGINCPAYFVKKASNDLFSNLEIGISARIKARQSSELNEFLLPEEAVVEAKNRCLNFIRLILFSRVVFGSPHIMLYYLLKNVVQWKQIFTEQYTISPSLRKCSFGNSIT